MQKPTLLITTVTAALIWALLLLGLSRPFPSHAEEANPNTVRPACNAIIGILIIATGIYIGYKLYQCAKKLANPPPPPPPPPDDGNPTNQVSQASCQFDDSGIGLYMLSTYGDPNFADGYGNYYNQMAAFNVQTSTNFVNWQTSCTVTSWISPAAVLTLVCTNGVPIYTNRSVGPTGYGTTGNTNTCVLPVAVIPTNKPALFFRLQAL